MPDAPLPAPFEAYVGDEPYLFASYAHLDGAVVFPELIYLRDQGYRVWYDEGIDPGNEWPEEVAKDGATPRPSTQDGRHSGHNEVQDDA